MSTNTASPTSHFKIPARHPEDYAGIVNRQRPQALHPMAISDRAAQFSPYAALVGHKEIITADEVAAANKLNLDDNITVEYDETF